MKKRIYISIPITGKDEKRQREHADQIGCSLSRKGYIVVNPFNIYAGKNPTYEDYITADLRAMMDCDGIFFCSGWEESCGCRIEHAVAMELQNFGKKLYTIMYEHGEMYD